MPPRLMPCPLSPLRPRRADLRHGASASPPSYMGHHRMPTHKVSPRVSRCSHAPPIRRLREPRACSGRTWRASAASSPAARRRERPKEHSEALKGTQRHSEALRGTQKYSEALGSTQRHSHLAMSSRSSVSQRSRSPSRSGSQSESSVDSSKAAYRRGPIRPNQWRSVAISRNQMERRRVPRGCSKGAQRVLKG